MAREPEVNAALRPPPAGVEELVGHLMNCVRADEDRTVSRETDAARTAVWNAFAALRAESERLTRQIESIADRGVLNALRDANERAEKAEADCEHWARDYDERGESLKAVTTLLKDAEAELARVQARTQVPEGFKLVPLIPSIEQQREIAHGKKWPEDWEVGKKVQQEAGLDWSVVPFKTEYEEAVGFYQRIIAVAPVPLAQDAQAGEAGTPEPAREAEAIERCDCGRPFEICDAGEPGCDMHLIGGTP